MRPAIAARNASVNVNQRPCPQARYLLCRTRSQFDCPTWSGRINSPTPPSTSSTSSPILLGFPVWPMWARMTTRSVRIDFSCSETTARAARTVEAGNPATPKWRIPSADKNTRFRALTGKAFFIYWPHGVPISPDLWFNFLITLTSDACSGFVEDDLTKDVGPARPRLSGRVPRRGKPPVSVCELMKRLLRSRRIERCPSCRFEDWKNGMAAAWSSAGSTTKSGRGEVVGLLEPNGARARRPASG